MCSPTCLCKIYNINAHNWDRLEIVVLSPSFIADPTNSTQFRVRDLTLQLLYIFCVLSFQTTPEEPTDEEYELDSEDEIQFEEDRAEDEHIFKHKLVFNALF